jgi:hypothetical protein
LLIPRKPIFFISIVNISGFITILIQSLYSDAISNASCIFFNGILCVIIFLQLSAIYLFSSNN